jgi:hypothetical protein
VQRVARRRRSQRRVLVISYIVERTPIYPSESSYILHTKHSRQASTNIHNFSPFYDFFASARQSIRHDIVKTSASVLTRRSSATPPHAQTRRSVCRLSPRSCFPPITPPGGVPIQLGRGVEVLCTAYCVERQIECVDLRAFDIYPTCLEARCDSASCPAGLCRRGFVRGYERRYDDCVYWADVDKSMLYCIERSLYNQMELLHLLCVVLTALSRS